MSDKLEAALARMHEARREHEALVAENDKLRASWAEPKGLIDDVLETLGTITPEQAHSLATLAAETIEGLESQRDPWARVRQIADPDNPAIQQGLATAKALGSPVLATILEVGEQFIRAIPAPTPKAHVAYKATALGLGTARMLFSPSTKKDPAAA